MERLTQKFGQNLVKFNDNNQKDSNHSIRREELENIKLWQKVAECLLKINKVRKRQFLLSFSVFSVV